MYSHVSYMLAFVGALQSEEVERRNVLISKLHIQQKEMHALTRERDALLMHVDIYKRELQMKETLSAQSQKLYESQKQILIKQKTQNEQLKSASKLLNETITRLRADRDKLETAAKEKKQSLTNEKVEGESDGSNTALLKAENEVSKDVVGWVKS